MACSTFAPWTLVSDHYFACNELEWLFALIVFNLTVWGTYWLSGLYLITC